MSRNYNFNPCHPHELDHLSELYTHLFSLISLNSLNPLTSLTLVYFSKMDLASLMRMSGMGGLPGMRAEAGPTLTFKAGMIDVQG